MKRSLLILTTLTLVACSQGPNGVRVVNGGSSAIPSKQGATIRNLSGPEIGQTVTGKSFQFTRTGASGLVTSNTLNPPKPAAYRTSRRLAGSYAAYVS